MSSSSSFICLPALLCQHLPLYELNPAHFTKSGNSLTGKLFDKALTRKLRSFVRRTTSRNMKRISPAGGENGKKCEKLLVCCRWLMARVHLPRVSSTLFLHKLDTVSRILLSFDFCSSVSSSTVKMEEVSTLPLVVTHLEGEGERESEPSH